MDLKHSSALLRQKQSERQSTDASYEKDKKNAEKYERDINKLEVSSCWVVRSVISGDWHFNLQSDLSKINYQDGTLEELQQQQETLQRNRRDLKVKLDQMRAYRFEMQYQDPYPNFNRNSVKGRVCNLFDVKNQQDHLPLSMVAGGSVSCSLYCFYMTLFQSFRLLYITVVQRRHRHRCDI